jgi:hypothetical protein
VREQRVTSLDQARVRPHLRAGVARDPGVRDDGPPRGEGGDARVRLPATAGGDRRRLRGLPVVGVGLAATAGSDPVASLLAKERRERRG